MRRGRLDHWNDAKDYGFIKPEMAGVDRVFAHISVFEGTGRPQQGDIVEYVTEFDAKARMRASRVRLVDANKGRSSVAERSLTERKLRESICEPSEPRPFAGAMFSLLFLLFLTGSTLGGFTQLAWALLYCAASLVTFFAYAIDKRAARIGAWRTRESTLHVFELLGGWPGALFAQRYLHHKSRKISYQVVFWFVAALNIAAFAYSFTAEGSELASTAFGEISEEIVLWFRGAGVR
jgi:uncharacterized membrane protein YsdA (DUF1294 family)/cold shock CspA family protein